MHQMPFRRLLLATALIVGFVSTAKAEPMILKWKGAEKDPHPCLYVTAKDVAAARKSRSDLQTLAEVKTFNADGNVEQLIAAALLTDNQIAHREVVKAAKAHLSNFIHALPVTFQSNKGPHSYAKPAGMAVSLADAALAIKTISPEDRAEILSKIAEACTLVNRPDYWGFNPWRGSYNPNMWTSAVGYRLALAALIPSHPKAKEWFNKALAEHRKQIDEWIDPRGGNAECPHYAIVSLNQWIGSCVIARNAGAANDGTLFDPKLKLAVMCLGNISTPRDAKAGNLRRLPTLGHTYANERTNTFGLMACLWKDKDPEFAAEMEWMHREHGSFGEPGILSYYPAFMGYKSFFQDSGVKPKQPNWTSQCYPEVGVQLRNVIGSDRETTLYMIAGRHHNHFFNDSGSITVWGKGAELCHEDDYQQRRPTVSGPYQVGMYREVHSMPDNPSTYSVERVMDLREFSTAPDFDYTSGVRQGWQRQVAFIKDKDPLAPNYFVIADTFDKTAAPTIWRLYVAGDCTPIPNGVTVNAWDRKDVAMDVIFLPSKTYEPQIMKEKQHIHVAVPKSGTLTAILYPRLKSEPTPTVSMLADGKGIEVKTAAGTDVIYLSPEAVKSKLGGKPFEGKVGLAKKRGRKTVVVTPGECDVEPGWEGGDHQTRELRWEGPQFPKFPDYEEALVPNQGNVLVVGGKKPAVAEGFTLPITVVAPRQSTTVAVTADDQALDLVFTCLDRDILGEIKEQDNIKLWKDDCVYVWLDTSHAHENKKQHIMLQVSVSGAVHDLRNGDAAWNITGLKVTTDLTGDGWKAHIRVPWKGLGLEKPGAGTVWGINFSRMDQPGKVDHGAMQMSSWVAIPNGSELIDPDRWGHLLFTADGDDGPARAAMEKVHNAIKARAYSPDVLLHGKK